MFDHHLGEIAEVSGMIFSGIVVDVGGCFCWSVRRNNTYGHGPLCFWMFSGLLIFQTIASGWGSNF